MPFKRDRFSMEIKGAAGEWFQEMDISHTIPASSSVRKEIPCEHSL